MSKSIRSSFIRPVSPRFRQRLARSFATFAVMGLALLLPLAARAHDEDEAPNAPDPQAMAAQRKVFTVVGVMAAGGIGWYAYRRWQLNKALAAGQYTDGQGTQ